MTANSVRIILFGAGRMGMNHVTALASLYPLVRVVAVVDTNRPAAVEAARLLAVAGDPPEIGTDPVLMLDQIAADACVVVTPTPSHGAIVRAALQRGRHVLCEKPLTFDTSESIELGELAAARNLVLAVGFYRRFSPVYTAARDVLRGGLLGRPVLIRACQWDAAPPSPEFLTGSGGLALDCGIHEFDLIEWITGRYISQVRTIPLRLVSDDVAAAGDVDNLAIEARLEDGATALIDLSRNCGYGDDVRTEVLGEWGALFVETLPHAVLTVGTEQGRRSIDLADTSPAFEAGIAGELRAFAVAVAGGTVDGLATAFDSARAADLAAAVSESGRLAQAVEVAAAPVRSSATAS